MKEYHKIQTVFKREIENNGKALLIGQWTTPEFEYLANNIWVYTEKVDGTNIRIMFDGEKVSFGGKSDNAQIPAKLVGRLRERFPDSISDSVENVRLKVLSETMGWRFGHPDRYSQEEEWRRLLAYGKVVSVSVSVEYA